MRGMPSPRWTSTAIPEGPSYHLDVDGFGKALHIALKDSVVGYVMRLRQNGTTIYTLEWNWAKTPTDGGEGVEIDRPPHRVADALEAHHVAPVILPTETRREPDRGARRRLLAAGAEDHSRHEPR